MGKFPKPLNTPSRSAEPSVVNIVTPDEPINPEFLNLESSYLSICCLLQTESLASISLVTEYDMITKMVDRLITGAPRDIEELSLGAIASALSWLPFDTFTSCATNGLVELCYQMIVRFVERRDLKTLDKSCELAIGILRDIIRLDDKVCHWGMGHLEFFVKIAIECPVTYPSVVIKRSMLRLIYTLISETETSFSHDILSNDYWCLLSNGSGDLEVRCFVLMTALCVKLPSATLTEFDLAGYLNEAVNEAATFTHEPTDEEELRLSNWRSKIRGLGTLLTFLSEAIVENEEPSEETDSIENKTFSTSKPTISLPSIFGALSARNLSLIVDSLVHVCARINQRDTPSELLVLEDGDLVNVFDLVASFVKIAGYMSYRMETDNINNEVVSVILKIFEITRQLDLHMHATLSGECTGTIWQFLLSIVAGKNTFPVEVDIANLIDLMKHLLSVFWDDDEQKIVGQVALMNIFDSIQMIFSLNTNCQAKCAEILVKTLQSIREEKISVESICCLSESVFVVFSESDFDDKLHAIEWIKILTGMAAFLKAQQSSSDQYVSATVSNLKAFLAYKKK